MTRILIPTPLRAYTERQDAVEAAGATIGEALADLTARFTDLRQHLFTPEGRLRSFVNVYVNDDDIRYLQREATPLKVGDVVSIVPSVAGGAPGAEVATPTELSADEIKRYSRHLIMPEVGVDGQRRLKAASVLCIGAGGLGSPAALYLAAAGVGRLGIVDFDVVDFSNLHRQILHGTPDVGRPKLQSARERLAAINPEIQIDTYETALTSKNALDLFRDYDVIRRRHRQLSDALPRERRVRAAEKAERLRQHLPLRGTGVRLRGAGRSVLPLPLSRASATGPRSELRGRGRTRRASGRDRNDPGDRSDQADSRRRASRWSAVCCSTTPST